jgi:hypothetical protein
LPDQIITSGHQIIIQELATVCGLSVVLRPQLDVLTPPGPREQMVDFAVRMSVDVLGEHIGHVGERIDVVQLAAFDQGRDDGLMLSAAVGAGERSILSVECDRADGAFDGVVVGVDAAIIDEARDDLILRSGARQILARGVRCTVARKTAPASRKTEIIIQKQPFRVHSCVWKTCSPDSV